jgi:hypothetical protein
MDEANAKGIEVLSFSDAEKAKMHAIADSLKKDWVADMDSKVYRYGNL